MSRGYRESLWVEGARSVQKGRGGAGPEEIRARLRKWNLGREM